MASTKKYTLTKGIMIRLETHDISLNCTKCKKSLDDGMEVLSKRAGKSRKLYDMDCAKLVHLI